MRPKPLMPILVMFFACFVCFWMGFGRTGYLSIPASGGQSANGPGCPLLQFEVDGYRVSPSREKAGRRRVDLEDTPGRCHDTFVHDDIARGADYLEVGDPAVRLDLDAETGNEIGSASDTGRLIPDAEKAVVDMFVERTEKAVPAPASRTHGRTGRRTR